MPFTLPHKQDSLSVAGIILSDEREVSNLKHRCLKFCLPLLLLTCPLPPLYSGFLLGSCLTLYLAIKLWLNLAASQNGYRRIRLSTASPLNTLLNRDINVATEVYLLDKLEDMGTETDENKNFVDVWNMWPVQLGEYEAREYDEKETHSVLLEVVGQQMRLLYPVHNLPRSYVRLEGEVVVYQSHHSVDLTRAEVSLVNPSGKAATRFSNQLPLCVKSNEPTGSLTFYLFPIVKRNKEYLYKLLQSRNKEFPMTKKDSTLDVDHVISECKLLGQDQTTQMINVLANKLVAKQIVEDIILRQIKNAFQKELVAKLNRYVQNVRIVKFGLGKHLVVQQIRKPYSDARGLWAQLDISCGEGSSITIEMNRLNLPSYLQKAETEFSSDEGSDSETEAEPTMTEVIANIAQFMDREVNELAFTLEVVKLEIEVVVNLPPKQQLDHVWIGLAKVPELKLRAEASGASPRLNNLLNSLFLPRVVNAIPKIIKRKLKTKCVLPHMMYFSLPVMKDD